MIRALTVALALALAAPPALALTQLEQSVQRSLREYGFDDVDVQDLTTGQLATIQHIANGKGREGEKRAKIRSALGRRDTLRGILGLGR